MHLRSLMALVSALAGLLLAPLATAHSGSAVLHGPEHGIMHMLTEHLPLLIPVLLVVILVSARYRRSRTFVSNSQRRERQ